MHFSCRSLKLDCPFPKDAHWWWWCSKLTSHLLRVLSPPRWVWEVDFSAHDSVNFFHTVHIIFFFLYSFYICQRQTTIVLKTWWYKIHCLFYPHDEDVLVYRSLIDSYEYCKKKKGFRFLLITRQVPCVMSTTTVTKTCLFSTHIFMPNNPFFFEVVQN